MRWIGHAGLAASRPGGAPDRACLDLARRLRLDRLEVDVCVAAGGALLLRHDHLLADGRPVDEVDVDWLRRTDPGMLTLDEAVEHLGGMPVLLDLKGQAVIEPLARWLSARRHLDGIAVCTDDTAALVALRERAPRVEIWRTLPPHQPDRGERRQRVTAAVLRHRLVRALPTLTGDVGAAGVCVDQWAVSAGLCAGARALGLPVTAWTVNWAPGAHWVARCGVDFITTDRVVEMRRALGEGV